MVNATRSKSRYLGRWTKTLPERFWEKVAPAAWDECWLWTASVNDAGYGQFAIDGMPRRAHRVAYDLMIGPIPEGLHLDHLCRVRRCVNPYHLGPVTNAVNIARGDHTCTRPLVTHCPSGHEYTAENTYLHPRGDGSSYRSCRECNNKRTLANYHAKRDGPVTKIGSRGRRLLCVRGHNYAETERITASGLRVCRECERIRAAK